MIGRPLQRAVLCVAALLLAAVGGGALAVGANSGGAGGAGQATLNGATAVAGGAAGTGSSSQPGFGCQQGTWGVQNGALTCVITPPTAVTSVTSHWGFVNVISQTQWSSSPVLQLVGENNDIRIDALSQAGNIIASCYLSALNSPCDVAGLTGSANATYQTGATLPTAAGTLKDAAELIAANAGLGGSNAGINGADNYVITALIDANSNLVISIAGYFTYSGTASMTVLTPIFATISIPATTLANSTNGTVYTATGVCLSSC
jgi:hypothetical protein